MATQAEDAADGEPAPADVSCDLDATPTREVRSLMRGLLAGRDGVMVDDALLVADELISNAHQHASGPRVCRLALLDQGRRLRVEVDDGSRTLPQARTPDCDGGRGLLLVSQLASEWGVRRYRDHKTVWAELGLDGAGTSGHARHMATAPAERQADQAPRSPAGDQR
ncbi:ATP-binding protein [Labedaea rhizosphaerae]|nr:ATP-binding protein [Labedaea rhizosphaerae]